MVAEELERNWFFRLKQNKITNWSPDTKNFQMLLMKWLLRSSRCFVGKSWYFQFLLIRCRDGADELQPQSSEGRSPDRYHNNGDYSCRELASFIAFWIKYCKGHVRECPPAGITKKAPTTHRQDGCGSISGLD